MITLQELSLYLNQLLQVPGLIDYCKNGLQVEGSSKILKIATAVSANLETIEKAVSLNANFLFVHHGLFWNGDSYEITGVKKKKILALLQHDISLFASHLPLDANREFGNNWKAAKDMNWQELEPFGNFNGIPIGVKGKFKPILKNQFKENVENYYGHPATAASFGKEEISSAALISGGAYKSILEAANASVDCFITGNFDEPAWSMAKEENMHFLALGHSATERVGPKAIATHLNEKFGIESVFIDTYNPF